MKKHSMKHLTAAAAAVALALLTAFPSWAASTTKKITSVTLIGLCTDICVISNAMIIKAFLPETEVIADASCCAGVTPESHRRALEAMEVCHIRVENKQN